MYGSSYVVNLYKQKVLLQKNDIFATVTLHNNLSGIDYLTGLMRKIGLMRRSPASSTLRATHALLLKITLLQRTNGTISRQMRRVREGFARSKILGGSRNQKTYKSMLTSGICVAFMLQQRRSLGPPGHHLAA